MKLLTYLIMFNIIQTQHVATSLDSKSLNNSRLRHVHKDVVQSGDVFDSLVYFIGHRLDSFKRFKRVDKCHCGHGVTVNISNSRFIEICNISYRQPLG